MSFLEVDRDDDKATFNYGRWQNWEVETVAAKDPQYLRWLLDNGMSGRDAKIFKAALEDDDFELSEIVHNEQDSG